MKKSQIIFVLLGVVLSVTARQKPNAPIVEYFGQGNPGSELKINVYEGTSHNHPLFAIWLENMQGEFIQTLYVSKSVGSGIYPRAQRIQKQWKEGIVYRPAALPRWSHQRGVPNEFGGFIPTPQTAEIDACTGATPSHSFIFYITTQEPLVGSYRVLIEVNQPWDWNDVWTNNKYPGDKDYMTSSQPAVVYQAVINSAMPNQPVNFIPIGYSHYAGVDGEITPDLSTLTTALDIFKIATVTLIEP